MGERTPAAASIAALMAKIEGFNILNPRIRAKIDPKPRVSSRKWQSGPSPRTPRGRGAKKQIKNRLEHSQVSSIEAGGSHGHLQEHRDNTPLEEKQP
jgi:hypothetical protein